MKSNYKTINTVKKIDKHIKKVIVSNETQMENVKVKICSDFDTIIIEVFDSTLDKQKYT